MPSNGEKQSSVMFTVNRFCRRTGEAHSRKFTYDEVRNLDMESSKGVIMTMSVGDHKEYVKLLKRDSDAATAAATITSKTCTIDGQDYPYIVY